MCLALALSINKSQGGGRWVFVEIIRKTHAFRVVNCASTVLLSRITIRFICFRARQREEKQKKNKNILYRNALRLTLFFTVTPEMWIIWSTRVNPHVWRRFATLGRNKIKCSVHFNGCSPRLPQLYYCRYYYYPGGIVGKGWKKKKKRKRTKKITLLVVPRTRRAAAEQQRRGARRNDLWRSNEKWPRENNTRGELDPTDDDDDGYNNIIRVLCTRRRI